MTGTAKTEEKEFKEIYDLTVVEIPTNEPMVRDDKNDYIYKHKEAKYEAVLRDIKERHEIGQPVLVGTISVEVSEHLAQLLTRAGIPHNVLNAKNHEREAEIIMDAGQPGAVTIATNMAGRGVDIKLGEGVRELGGLYVVGTERHEARRIDNQLRGRSGRQGDPGETRFYLSAEDELVRLFAGDRIYRIIDKFGLPDDEPMESGILSKQIEGAQKKVEEQNFVSRKNVLKYDDVMNVQRMVIYEQRQRVLQGEDLSEDIKGWADEVVESIVLMHTEGDYTEEWDLPGLLQDMSSLYESEITAEELTSRAWSREELVEEFLEDAQDAYAAKEEELGSELMREVERFILLQIVDARWREHLDVMEYLREGIHLRAMAQKDPLSEYRSEGHAMFTELSDDDPRGGAPAPVPRAGRPGRGRRAAPAADAGGRERRRERQPRLRARVARRLRGHPGRGRGRRRRAGRPRPAASRRGTSSASPRSSTRSGATTPAPAAPARSSRSATAHSRLAAPRLGPSDWRPWSSPSSS